jgi:hypothetical protein
MHALSEPHPLGVFANACALGAGSVTEGPPTVATVPTLVDEAVDFLCDLWRWFGCRDAAAATGAGAVDIPSCEFGHEPTVATVLVV